jgi:hypothetical protein
MVAMSSLETFEYHQAFLRFPEIHENGILIFEIFVSDYGFFTHKLVIYQNIVWFYIAMQEAAFMNSLNLSNK